MGVANYFLGVDSRLRGANATTVADVPRATVAVRRLGLKMSEDYGEVVKTYSYGHLSIITGYKWDYTFYKWGYKYL